MTLHDYLQSEQARSDVRELLDSCDGAENSWADKTVEGGFHWMTEDAGAWWRVGLEDSHAHNVYYRPDGNRYIVTDLGEGVRALRLRTGVGFVDLLQKCRRSKEANHFYGLFGQIHDATIGAGNWERGLAIGALLDVGTYADESNLPDAICRVMLASLRAAEVTP